MESKNCKIVGVDKDNSLISYMDNGERRTKTVVSPADIKFIREGDAELRFNEQGYVSFVKMIKKNSFDKPKKFNTANSYEAPKEKTYSRIKTFRGLSDIELESVYNEIAEKYFVKATQSFEDDKDKSLWKGIIYYSVKESQLVEETEGMGEL